MKLNLFGKDYIMLFIKKLAIITVCVFSLPLMAAKPVAKKNIAMIMFSTEIRYEDAAKGFLEVLKKRGYGENKINVTKESADGNKAKVVEIINRVKLQKPDLIFTTGTSSAILVAHEFKDIPIVFAVVYDPVEAGISKSWKSSENNTTGTTTFVQTKQLLELLNDFTPVKKLAVLYTPHENNSEIQLKNLQKTVDSSKVKVIPIPLANKEDIEILLPEMLKTADALYITGSNLISTQVPHIAAVAAKAKIATITHLEDLVHQGVLIGLCGNTRSMGELAAEKAIKILTGTKPAAIPIDSAPKMEVLFNMKSAKEGQFKIPEKFMKQVTVKIE